MSDTPQMSDDALASLQAALEDMPAFAFCPFCQKRIDGTKKQLLAHADEHVKV